MRNHRHWYWLGLPVGLGVAIKSLAALPIAAVVLLTVVLWRAAGVPITKQQWRALLCGALIALGIGLPWYLVEFAKYGALFLHDSLLIHLQGVSGVTGNNNGDWRFYLLVMAEGLPFWQWLLPPALALAAWRAAHQRDALALMLLLWVSVPFTLYSVARTKLPWYILPTYPALALLVAWFLWTVVPRQMLLQGLLVTALLGVTVAWDVRTIAPLDRAAAVKAVARCAVKTTGADETIAYFDPISRDPSGVEPYLNVRPSVRFYLDRPMLRLSDRAEVEEWLTQGGKHMWTKAEWMERIPNRFVIVSKQEDQRFLQAVDGPDSRQHAALPCDNPISHPAT